MRKYIDAALAERSGWILKRDFGSGSYQTMRPTDFPAADIEHEMAVILVDLFGCPLDYDIGEDLCEVCDFVKGVLPCTSDDAACWEQYLKHRKEVQG